MWNLIPWKLVVKELAAYLENHPEVIAQLVEEAVQAGLGALKANNSAAPTP